MSAKKKYMKIEAYQMKLFKKEDINNENWAYFKLRNIEDKYNDLKEAKDHQILHGLFKHELSLLANKKNNQYELVFNKLSSTDFPIIIDEEGNFSDMKDNISDDKNIGNLTCAIYDDVNKILLVQVNFNSMNVRQIEKYFNELFVHDDYVLKLEPLINRKFYERVKSKTKSKFEVSMLLNSGVSEKTNRNGIFFKKYEEARSINAVRTSFTFSMGQIKNETLEDTESNLLIEDIVNNQEIVPKAKVSFKEQMDSKPELADLLNMKMNSIVDFDIPERATLREDAILNKIRFNYEDEFKERINEFFRDFGRR
ncbi:hypothetical protein WN59_06730 [Salinicoccus sediminis]|uniref:DUF4747 domain-containing protein n=1 Tax=Salinicoccus sediminis TaxID=1432562 RepID=A0A0M2SKD7_9STAP|nr:DUF6731 family protein [Salinicoccus sediminis]KKK34718.1 hypothetical protein WN59_06730 [Salinicoccus sediminis]